jgi:hypothetical protein
MAINRTDITVANEAALSQVHVAELRDGANAWITSRQRYAILYKSSTLTPDGVDVIAPISGSPIAGGPQTVWVVGTSGGRFFFEELSADVSVTTAPPTLPLNYGPGQPTTIVTMTEEFRAGPVLLTATYNGFVTNNGTSAVEENQAFGDVAIFIDGVRASRAADEFFFEQQPTAVAGPGKIIGMSGTIQIRPTLTAGTHVITLRIGASGTGPLASATIMAGSPAFGNTMPPNYATLSAQEV